MNDVYSLVFEMYNDPLSLFRISCASRYRRFWKQGLKFNMNITIDHSYELRKQAPFGIKGTLFALNVLELRQTDLSLFGVEVEQMVAKTPKFFSNMPVVLDFQKINRKEDQIDFGALRVILQKHRLILVGVRGGNTQQNQSALLAGIAVMQGTKNSAESNEEITPTSTEPRPSDSPSKIITLPIRSGQQVYAKGGDLIILSTVSPGAEILADGNIHVYGTLRGRALAGIQGDKTARIFCRELDAELVSIAGHYVLKDALTKNKKESASYTHIYLENDTLEIKQVD